MPVTPTYAWTQTDDEIEIQVQISGVHSRLLRHITQITPVFFNLNFSPYLLQIDFEREVNPLNVKVVLLQNKKEIKFIFPKKVRGEEWKDLITDTSRELRLQRRHESIETLHAKQQEIRERRAKQRNTRQRAAQQRQWDEQKYLKHVMNKLEREEQEKCAKELQQWTADSDHDDNKECSVSEIPAIRKAVDVDIKLSEWNYVVPARENCKPPPFAQKSVVFGTDCKETQLYDDIDEKIPITEKSPVFLFDKAVQYIIGKDYNSCVNVLDEIEHLPQANSVLLMLVHCHKMQCFISLYQARESAEKSEIESFALRALKTVQRMQQWMGKQQCTHEMDDKTAVIVEVIVLFQRCIAQSWCALAGIERSKELDDDDVQKLWRRGCKIFEVNQNAFDGATATNALGLFKDKNVVEELHRMAAESVNVIAMIACKQHADALLKEKKCGDAIEKYNRIIDQLQNTEHVSLLQQQCLNNRSTAYFSSKQFMNCVDDCSAIIASCNEAMSARVQKAYVKRAASYLALWQKNKHKNEKHYLEKCIGDYRVAAQHDPLYESYVSKIRKLIESQIGQSIDLVTRGEANRSSF